ncbi:MAG: sugar nucleotide-binding protein, partial [Flammeovirgaceae bacterium]|nr:sugar nucleotide-binding protein [Flammeovirgaceae bacterium]
PNPINFYGETKWEAEKIIRNSKTPWAIVRTCLVYGTNFQLTRSNIVLWVINNLRQRNPIRVVVDQWRTPTLVEDLAEGCLTILKRQAKGIFHLAGKDFLRPYDLAHLTAQIFDLDATLISPTDASQFKEIGKRPLKTGLDISKAKAELDYSPRSVVEGLCLMREQFKNF